MSDNDKTTWKRCPECGSLDADKVHGLRRFGRLGEHGLGKINGRLMTVEEIIGALAAGPVDGDVELIGSDITTLPPGTSVSGSLWLNLCKSLTHLPNGLKVGKDLNLYGCNSLAHLPDGLSVGARLRFVPRHLTGDLMKLIGVATPEELMKRDDDWPKKQQTDGDRQKCPKCGIDRPAPPHGRYCECGHDWKPKNLCAPGHPPSPTDFFRQAIGEFHHLAADIDTEKAVPDKINAIYTEARTRFPEAADIIAAMAHEIDQHRRRSQAE